MSTTTAATKRPPQTHSLYFPASVAAAIIIAVGFGCSIFPNLLLRLRPAILYLHALTAFAWITLVPYQAWLIRQRKLALHRKIGPYGLALGAVASITAFFTSFILRHESVIRHGNDGRTDARIAFLAIPLTSWAVFTILLALAGFWRNRPGLHRRCIMLSWSALFGAAIARIPVLGGIPFLADFLTVALIATLCVQEYRREHRVHPVYVAGLPAALIALLAGDYLAFVHPAWWVSAARGMIGL
jgi:hypothetical protein